MDVFSADGRLLEVLCCCVHKVARLYPYYVVSFPALPSPPPLSPLLCSTYRYETLVDVRRKHRATCCRATIIVAFLLMVLVALATGVLVALLRPWEREPATSSSLTSDLQVSRIMGHLQVSVCKA